MTASTSRETFEFFDTLARVLLRCTIFGFGLLMLWFVLLLNPETLIDPIHATFFGMKPADMGYIHLIHYSLMGLLKILVICFFAFPWAAIRLTLKKPAS